ncbi:MAG: PIN domain nuclease [Alphaproteobacteria bacterium]|nr:MAG: PIN domain nuclease [Alphaproteobacteria bacterium]
MGLIYLDSCLLIYLVEDRERRGSAVARAVASAEGDTFCISPLVKCECLAAPARRGDPVLRRAYQEIFAVFEGLEMPEPVFLEAASIRARFGLKTPDALHLACAQHHRCISLWTNDGRLAQAAHGLAVDILSSR